MSVLIILFSLAAARAYSQGGTTQAAGSPAGRQPAMAELAAKAQSALGSGDFATAIAAFEQLIKNNPGVAEFHSNLGVAYYSAGRAVDAIPEFRKALKLKPRLSSPRYFLGLSLAETSQCKEAIPALEQDYRQVPDRQLKRAMGLDAVRCGMAVDQTDKAVDFVRLLSKDFPDDPDVLYLSSQIYSELSTRASQRLMVTAPGSYQAHQMNAEVLEIQGKLTDAIEEYRKVLTLNPRLPGAHYQIGRLLLAGERGPTTFDEARREFEEDLKIDPANPAPEYELGELARQARQWNDAIEHFRRAVKLDPNFTDAQIGLGKSLVSAGRAADALVPLETAVRLAPHRAVAHYQLSFAYRRLGREQDAEREVAAYRQAHAQDMRARQAIRAGLLGRTSQDQTEEPPE